MRLAIALAAIVIGGPAWAQTPAVSVKVDRVYSTGSYITALARVTNGSDRMIGEARVECDLYDAQKQALGTGRAFPERIGAGQTVVAEIIAESPPDAPTTGLSAECRVLSVK